MRKALASTWAAYRQYRTAKAKNPIYRILRVLLVSTAVVYFLLLSFPQVLFAHQIAYRNSAHEKYFYQ